MLKKATNLLTIILLLAIAVANTTQAQVITTDPPFPTADAPVTIFFDATQGGGGLAGYTGDVYTHTGLIVQGNANWQHVIGSWGNNNTQPKLTRISANLYSLEITPSIRQFYGAPPAATIQKMAFVFRAASGSPQTEDLFVDVYEPGLNVSISAPQNASLFVPGDNIQVEAAASDADSMFLYLNNNVLLSVAGEQISYTLIAGASGAQWLKVLAKTQAESVADSVYFFVRGQVPVAALPAGVRNGINYHESDEKVTLVLHDPPALKEFVFAIGDFNNWMLQENYFMNRTPDGKHYWLTIENLEPGREYIYQYFIDGELRLADPYTHKVIDPWHDHWVPATTYPNLISYPDGKTTGLASVFQTAQTPYNWEVANFDPPAPTDLVIYELLIRDFIATRDIKTLIDTLDYLERLGINAIGLMPINEFEGNDSWGYNPSFYFASDKAYGRKQDYQRFIDECHKRGMAVILDMVLNHSFGQSPLVQMYFDPNAGQWGQPTATNPWYNQVCPHEPWCWGYDFDHLSPYTQEFVDRVNAHWLTEFKFDGFRFDFTKGFTNQQTGNQGSNYDAVRIGLLKRMADKIWEVNPNAYIILEHFCENSEEKELAEYGMMVWGNMNYNYNEATMGWTANSNFSGVSYKNRGWAVPHLVGYMESHDEERLMFKNIQYGNSSNPAHNVKELNVGLQRMETAAAFFFTIPGPKMIWQFGELGYDYSINHCPDGTINESCRTSAKPIRWNYLENPNRVQLLDAYSKLIHLKKEHDVFRTNDFNLSLSGALKRIKLNHETSNVVVIGNFGVTSGEISPQFHNTGWWYEFFSNDSINVSNVNMNIQLDPGEYRLYSSMKMVGLGEIPSNLNGGSSFNLFPNPAGDDFNVEFSLQQRAQVLIELYNLQGMKVAVLDNTTYQSGKHSRQFIRPSHLNSGVYLLKMQAAGNVASQKIVLD
jgi:glycosidase